MRHAPNGLVQTRRHGEGAPPTGWGPLEDRYAAKAARDLRVVKSDGANVLRLRALGTLRDVELDLLVLVQGLVPLALDGRVVHEDVVAAVLLCDEAEALLGVEPLHGALSHVARYSC